MPIVTTSTPAVVNSQGTHFDVASMGGATLDVPLAFTPTAGNAVIAIFDKYNEGDALPSLGDDAGSPWQFVDSAFKSGVAGIHRIEVWAVASALPGMTKLTLAFGTPGLWGGDHLRVVVFEVSGLDVGTYSSIGFYDADPVSPNPRTVDTDTYDGVSKAGLAENGSLSLLACSGIDLVPGTATPLFTADSSWTSLRSVISSTTRHLETYYKIAAPAPTAETADITLSDTTLCLNAMIVVFKAFETTVGGYDQTLTQAKALSDMQNSNFISETEWSYWIGAGYRKLYDLLVRTHEDYFEATTTVVTVAGQEDYTLPSLIYKVLSVEAVISATESRSLRPFHQAHRNYFSPYGQTLTATTAQVTNYRVVADKLRLRPIPGAGGETIRLRYVPVAAPLVAGEDLPNNLLNHFSDYISIYAAVQALIKEESDPSALKALLAEKEADIRHLAADRDSGDVQVVADIRGEQGIGSEADWDDWY